MVQMTCFKILAVILLAINAMSSYASEQKPGIEIGIAPFLPVKTLVQNYAALRDFLESKLKEPVTIVSAPDYKTYYKCIQKRDYQIIITNASSAYIAFTDYAYIPLLQPLNFTHPVVVIGKDQKLTNLTELRDKTIAMSDATAVVSMQGLHMLRDFGLHPGQNINIRNLQNHSAAVNYVITGDVAAAIVSDRALMQMPATIRDKVKIVYTWDKAAAPGIVYLGSPDVPVDRLKPITKAILEFVRETTEGKKMMLDTGYGDLIPVSPEDLQALAPYGILLKESLSENHK